MSAKICEICISYIPLHNFFLFSQRICRRLLAVYDLPSWGRCELALSLLQEHSAPYSLEDVVQAVRESHDKEFIKRVLAKECPICLSIFPHSKVSREWTFIKTSQLWGISKLISYFVVLSSLLPDAVSDIMPVFSVLWLFPTALHHCCKGQTHQRHGVSSLLGAWHQWPWTPQQLLLDPGHSGREELNRVRNEVSRFYFTNQQYQRFLDCQWITLCLLRQYTHTHTHRLYFLSLFYHWGLGLGMHQMFVYWYPQHRYWKLILFSWWPCFLTKFNSWRLWVSFVTYGLSAIFVYAHSPQGT